MAYIIEVFHEPYLAFTLSEIAGEKGPEEGKSDRVSISSRYQPYTAHLCQ